MRKSQLIQLLSHLIINQVLFIPSDKRERARKILIEYLSTHWDRFPTGYRQKFWNVGQRWFFEESIISGRPGPAGRRWLLHILGLEALVWNMAKKPGFPGTEALRKTIRKYLSELPYQERRELLRTGLMKLFGMESPEGKESLGELENYLQPAKEKPMAITFHFDKSGLPPSLENPGNQQQYVARVNEILTSLDVSDSDEITRAAVTGWLLLKEQFSPLSSGFSAQVKKIYLDHMLKDTKDADGNPITYKDVYQAIAKGIVSLPGHGEAIAYQELASAGEYVTERLNSVPLGHSYFPTQVRLGLDDYVAGEAPFASLSLPSLDGELGESDEIEPENIQATAMIYAVYQLEQTRIFDVADRLDDMFLNGQLAIGNDDGGRLLYDYHFSAEDRMDPMARMSQYTRIFGAPGGDVNRDAQVNKSFSGKFLRFISSVSEYQRQERIADLVSNRRRGMSVNQEHVRKAGRELAANLSLFGWGYAHFAAQQLNKQLREVLEILGNHHIQKAFGVNSTWQLVERVSQREFGHTPNITKLKTMAEAGKIVLDLIAKKDRLWTATSGIPLFADIHNATGFDRMENTGFSSEDTRTMFNNVEYWLAVNGIKEQQVDRFSQPEESSAMPSIPSFNGGGSGVGMDELKNMVSSGQTPTMDQLKSMFPNIG